MSDEQQSNSSVAAGQEPGRVVQEAPESFARIQELVDSVPVKEADSAEVRGLLDLFFRQAMANTTLVSPKFRATIDRLIQEIEGVISSHVNQILHHPSFQRVEATWRGLDQLVRNAPKGEDLEVRVLNIDKATLASTLADFEGDAMWDQSPIYKAVYEGGIGLLGGKPVGVLVGDYAFDHSATDVKTMAGMARVAGAAFCPFVASAAPSLLDLESWDALHDPSELATRISKSPKHAGWRSFRENNPDAKFVALTMPRYLGRLPWGGEDGNPVPNQTFRFVEEVKGDDHSKYLWCNAAYAMAQNLISAYKTSGWCTGIVGIDSGGAVEGLPVHAFPSIDGDIQQKCPTEISIPLRREKELAELGLMPLVHYDGSDFGVFMSAQTVKKPASYKTDLARQQNEAIAARLPYILATSRFAHYMVGMAQHWIGSLQGAGQLEKRLQDWLDVYTLRQDDADEELKRKKPLRDSKVVVTETDTPGVYDMNIMLQPHFGVEGVTMGVELTAHVKKT